MDIHRLAAGDITFLVATAEDVSDGTGMVVDLRIAVDMGARVGGTGAVAAAEDPLDAATVDDDVGSAVGALGTHIGSVAAAVDILDGIVASPHMHRGQLAGGDRLVVSLVAAAEDLRESETAAGSLLCRGAGSFVDVDGDIVLRASVGIVAAEDGAADSGVAGDTGSEAVAIHTTQGADVHGDNAVDSRRDGGDGFHCLVLGSPRVVGYSGHFLATQAAAIDVAAHITIEDVDSGSVAVVGSHVGQSAAAVDVACHHSVLLVEEHSGVATDSRQVAAAEDTAPDGDMRRRRCLRQRLATTKQHSAKESNNNEFFRNPEALIIHYAIYFIAVFHH